MDEFLHKLRELTPDGTVKKQILSQVAKSVDPSFWSDEKIELVLHTLPEAVPLDDLAGFLYDPSTAKGMPAAAKRLDPIVKDAEIAVLEAEVSQCQKASTPSAGKNDSDMNEEAWKELHGEILEPALKQDIEHGDSPVRLIDARFLIELQKRGGKLLRRQDLPDGAFLSLEAIKHMPRTTVIGSETLRIASVSHAWLQPDHPDPKGSNLGILAALLQTLLSSVGGTFAVFLDFACLFQKGPNAEERSDKEAALFKQALSNMMDWYSHPNVVTLKLSKMPEGYPEGFDFPEGVTPNTADYAGRGWCFCESSVSNLVKSSKLVFDLGKFSGKHKRLYKVCRECITDREAPLAPDDFRMNLSKKSFTSKKADETTVADLYEDTCKVRLGQAESLDYQHLGWVAADMALLNKMLGSVALPMCRELLLGSNQIGDQGVQWLSEALGMGALPTCQKLCLDTNKVGDEGMRWISEAFNKGGVPMCVTLSLHTNQITDAGLQWLSEALGKGALPVCEEFYFWGNRISHIGTDLFRNSFSKAGRSGLRWYSR